jgi:hypothetical protein
MPILHELREMLGDRFMAVFYILSVLQAALTVWMVVDAGRRHVDHFWFWLIIALQPFGAWAYFFLYKLPELHASGAGWRALFRNRVSLDELRYRAEHLPTLVNRVALAERLMEDHQFAEALPLLEAAHKAEPDHCQILYFLALCQARLDWPDEAKPLLERLLGREPRWRNYLAWQLLIAVQQHRGDQAGTLAACRELVRLAPTLQHQCLLARHLLDQGQTLEARDLLQKALRDHEYAPGPIRRRNSRWASEARRMQKMADGR